MRWWGMGTRLAAALLAVAVFDLVFVARVAFGDCDRTLTAGTTSRAGLTVPTAGQCGWDAALNATIAGLDTGAAFMALGQTWTGPQTFAPGTLLDQGSSLVNIRAFGAQGNGTADDTAAFVAATQATTTGRESFYVPPGTYRLTASLSLPYAAAPLASAGLTFRGAGPDLTVLTCGGEPCLSIAGPASHVTLENLTLQLDGTGNSQTLVQLTDGTLGVTLRNVVLRGTGTFPAVVGVGILANGSTLGNLSGRYEGLRFEKLATGLQGAGHFDHNVVSGGSCAQSASCLVFGANGSDLGGGRANRIDGFTCGASVTQCLTLQDSANNNVVTAWCDGATACVSLGSVTGTIFVGGSYAPGITGASLDLNNFIGVTPATGLPQSSVRLGNGVLSEVDSGGALRLLTGAEVDVGLRPDGTGIKHGRVTTGAITNGTDAAVGLTWTTAFADANYTASCNVVDATASASSLKIIHLDSVTAAAVTVRVRNDGAAPITGTLHCVGFHD